jgi:hypothetical protein
MIILALFTVPRGRERHVCFAQFQAKIGSLAGLILISRLATGSECQRKWRICLK